MTTYQAQNYTTEFENFIYGVIHPELVLSYLDADCLTAHLLAIPSRRAIEIEGIVLDGDILYRVDGFLLSSSDVLCYLNSL